MKFDLWTFFFQVINFAVLFFILKKLLYKPIREIILKRRDMVTKTIEDAEKTKKEAEEIKAKYLSEMQGLEETRAQALEDIRLEAARERESLLSESRKEAEKLIEKEKMLFEEEKKRFEADLKSSAIESVAIFSENLMKGIADAELHSAIVRRAIHDMGLFAPEIAGKKRGTEALNLDIAVAYPLTDKELREIKNLLEATIGEMVNINIALEQGLIAGIRTKMYDKIYDFSLKGQIELFKESLREL